MGALLLVSEQMHAESEYRQYPFAIDKMARLFGALIDGQGCVLVAERAGQIVGVMAGYCEESWFTPAKVAGEYGLYVVPEARGSRHAVGLVNAFREWALEQGADLIQIGITTGITTERTADLYERLGFRRCGIIFDYKG
ncbi:GNAT family N-acetyltransferase [Stenotrophomonas sp.]|uniref:GNAT family N-acetyltransferase n=1 Tax=Stenotrophomonas sp. TaxID=69392 RepID=UPI00289F952F|nr:GNAT family N-acetyltransferase [Stenotrophomonas sp.]